MVTAALKYLTVMHTIMRIGGSDGKMMKSIH